MDRKIKILFAVAVIFLLLAPDVLAISLEDILDRVPIPGLRAAAKMIKRAVQNLVTVATIGVLLNILVGAMISAFPEGILWNPTIVGSGTNPAIIGIIRTFMIILEPILILWIVIIGLYLILMSGSPAGRTRAKAMFWKAIFAMILFSLSMPLFQILLNVSRTLASIILRSGSVSPILGITSLLTPLFSFFTLVILMPSAVLEIHSGVETVSPLLITTTIIFMYLIALAVPLVIVLRYLVLTFLAVLFPFAILFNFIDVPFLPFKGIGEKLMRLTFLWTFAQVVMALVLVGISIIIANSPSILLTAILSSLGLFLVAAAPLMMTGLMRYIGAAIATIGMTLGPGIGSMMIGVGMLLAGSGSLASLSTVGVHQMMWGFRPGSTDSPLYRVGAQSVWPGWGIPTQSPGGGVSGPAGGTGGGGTGGGPGSPAPGGSPAGEVRPQPIQPKAPEKMPEKPNIGTARKYSTSGRENLDLAKNLKGAEKRPYLNAARDNFNEAFKELGRVGRRPGLAEEYFIIGRGFEMSGDLLMAVESYRIASEIAPNSNLKAKYLKALGEVYMKRG